MYLHRIKAENFRIFGDGKNAAALDWELAPSLNILVGENDAGKSAIIDAIRQVLWTTSFEMVRLSEQDFHLTKVDRSQSMVIEATLRGLSEDQEAAVLEWLTYEADGSCSLTLHLQARWIAPHGKRRGRVDWQVRSGPGGIGPEIGSTVREMVRSTYLRPLRDAEAELKPGRASRLSQILGAHQAIAGQEINDFDVANPKQIPKNLVGLMALAQHHMGQHEVIQAVQDRINSNYLRKLAFTGDPLASRIRLATELALSPILEKFELTLVPPDYVHSDARCNRGLGYNNVLFMATELVLLREGEDLGLLLIEEPEAHLHPQLQERVMGLLTTNAGVADKDNPVQVVLTTHSPSLVAGADLECMTLVVRGKTYRLAKGQTRLELSDYAYLRRFLEATRANLFFARGVAIVEGPGEGLLLPALAKHCGRSFSLHGISVVNVGDVGLYHYARILQRSDDTVTIDVPVACITDRDVVPKEAKYVTRPKKGKRFDSDYDPKELERLIERKQARATGGSTKVFVSDCWTLEFDMALAGCSELMYIAIQLAIVDKAGAGALSDDDYEAALAGLKAGWPAYAAAAASPLMLAVQIYEPLYEKDASKAVTAQYAARLLETGGFGNGDELFLMLPRYLQEAMAHLTGPAPIPPAVVAVKMAP